MSKKKKKATKIKAEISYQKIIDLATLQIKIVQVKKNT